MERDILRVEDLHVAFITSAGPVNVINGVDFSLQKEEATGILGESGSGKTVLSKAILNVIPPPGQVTEGSILFLNGEDLVKKPEDEMRLIRGNEIAMIPSNPHERLNPMEDIATQMINVCLAHRDIRKKDALSIASDMLEKVQIPDVRKRLWAYPHELSGGMAQRVLIAMALIHSPRLIVADHPTFGLDVTTQLQILDLLQELISTTESGLMMITSDVGIITHYCDKIAVLYHGRVFEYAGVDEFLKGPNHPYSVLLITAATLDMRKRKLVIRKSEKLDMINPPRGCYFSSICQMAQMTCKRDDPPLREISKKHFIRCHFTESL